METKRFWDERAARMAEDAAVEARVAAVYANAHAEAVAYAARRDAEWTREVTAARRVTWNAAVKAGRITGANGKVDVRKVAALGQELGFSPDELRDAIRRHGL